MSFVSRVSVIVLMSAVVFGCSSSHDEPTSDSVSVGEQVEGVTTPVDAGADAHDAAADAHDAAVDAHDAAVDSATDAHDASADSGPDAHDAAVDAHDAAVDAVPDARDAAAVDAATDAHDAAVDAVADAHDAAVDARDSGPDAADAGTDARDAGPDATDAATDARDATVDAADAHVDSSVAQDAGVDASGALPTSCKVNADCNPNSPCVASYACVNEGGVGCSYQIYQPGTACGTFMDAGCSSFSCSAGGFCVDAGAIPEAGSICSLATVDSGVHDAAIDAKQDAGTDAGASHDAGADTAQVLPTSCKTNADCNVNSPCVASGVCVNEGGVGCSFQVYQQGTSCGTFMDASCTAYSCDNGGFCVNVGASASAGSVCSSGGGGGGTSGGCTTNADCALTSPCYVSATCVNKGGVGCSYAIEQPGVPCGVAMGSSCPYSYTCDQNGSCNPAPGSADAGKSWCPLPVQGSPCTLDSQCNNGNICLSFSCSAGQCDYGFTGSVCGDAPDLCTGPPVCQGASCVPGSAYSLDDGNQCTADSCNPTTGITHTPLPDGTSCVTPPGMYQVNPACVGASVCNPKTQCVQKLPNVGAPCQPLPGSGVACSAGPFACVDAITCSPTAQKDPCYVWTCDADGGGREVPAAAGVACGDNSNKCAGAWACNGSGGCSQGPAPVVPASTACQTVTCNPATGLVYTNAATGTSCGDSANLCVGPAFCSSANPAACARTQTMQGTQADVYMCAAGSGLCGPAQPAPVPSTSNPCVAAVTCIPDAGFIYGPVSVDDKNACTQDSCQPATGIIHTPISGCGGSTTDHWSVGAGRPSPRDGVTGGFFPSSGQLAVFGGENSGVPLADTWTWTPSTEAWSVSYAGGPGARVGAAAVVDTSRNELVLIGGYTQSGGYMNDVWEYSVATGTWQQRSPAGPLPNARAGASVAYDSARKVVVMFGGRGASGPPDTGLVWSWNGATGQWMSQSPSAGPPMRTNAPMVYDTARSLFVLAGGESLSSAALGAPLGDTWEYSASTGGWAMPILQANLPARLGHGAVFDSARGVTVVFGGTGATPVAMNDTWEYQPTAATWVQRATPVAPSPRAGLVFAYDSVRSKSLLFGGLSYTAEGTDTPETSSLWEYDGPSGTWMSRTQSGAPGQWVEGIAYDSARHALLLQGLEPWPLLWQLNTQTGYWASEPLLDGTTAQDFPATYTAPSASGSYYASYVGTTSLGVAFDPATGRELFLRSGGSTPDGTAGWAPVVFARTAGTMQTIACPNGPAGLAGASATYDPSRGVVQYFGGDCPTGGLACQPSSLLPNVWELNVATCAWTNRAAVAGRGPSTRLSPQIAWDAARGVAIMVGGSAWVTISSINGSGPVSAWQPATDQWEWNSATATWQQDTPSVMPAARQGAAFAYDPVRRRTVLFSGSNGAADTWEFDGTNWAPMTLPMNPPARSGASATFDTDRNAIVIHGGGALNDVWEYNGLTWTNIAVTATPPARSGASGGWSPTTNSAYLFGGVSGDGNHVFTNDTWGWDGKAWALLSDGTSPNPGIDTPSPRAGHAFAVGAMYSAPTVPGGIGLMFGGEGPNGLLNDTWAFADLRNRGYSYLGGGSTWQLMPNAGTPSAKIAPTPPPSARAGHAMVALPPSVATTSPEFVMFGGQDATGLLNDSYRWTANSFGGATYNGAGLGINGAWSSNQSVCSWQPGGVCGQGAPPSPRRDLAMAYDSARSMIILFGGRDANGPQNDTWETSSFAGGSWVRRSPPVVPPARFGHTLTYDSARHTVLLSGGIGATPGTALTDMWEWNGNDGTWTPVQWAQSQTTASLTPRVGAFSVFDPTHNQLMFFGGLTYAADGQAVATYGDTQVLIRSEESTPATGDTLNGFACQTSAGCASGFCVAGVCCNSACTGACQTCSAYQSAGVCMQTPGMTCAAPADAGTPMDAAAVTDAGGGQ